MALFKKKKEDGHEAPDDQIGLTGALTDADKDKKKKDKKKLQKAGKKEIRLLEKQLRKGNISQEDYDKQAAEIRVGHGLEAVKPAPAPEEPEAEVIVEADVDAAVIEAIEEVETPAAEVKIDAAEQERIARCEKILGAARIPDEDKERLKPLIMTGASPLELTNEIKKIIESGKKKAHEKIQMIEEDMPIDLKTEVVDTETPEEEIIDIDKILPPELLALEEIELVEEEEPEEVVPAPAAAPKPEKKVGFGVKRKILGDKRKQL
ncbi:MAG: hypothetical protein KAX31_05075, partial [Thermoplasmata archaeon]|nr:hypothetical protein [Thermoplasmata archaeon]